MSASTSALFGALGLSHSLTSASGAPSYFGPRSPEHRFPIEPTSNLRCENPWKYVINNGLKKAATANHGALHLFPVRLGHRHTRPSARNLSPGASPTQTTTLFAVRYGGHSTKDRGRSWCVVKVISRCSCPGWCALSCPPPSSTPLTPTALLYPAPSTPVYTPLTHTHTQEDRAPLGPRSSSTSPRAPT